MLTRVPFYYGTTRKMVVGFAGLFSNIYIRTRVKDGTTKKIVKVPLAYANKEKFIVRLQQDPGLNEDTQINLPRMSFEITGYDYDAPRQLNKIHRHIGTQDGRPVKQFAPVPYTLTFSLYTFTRTIEDNLQIMEQILPYFTPDMNLSIKVLQNPDVTQDCTLRLNGVSVDDSYDGGFEDRRYIISTYTFNLDMCFYGPILGTKDEENHFEDGPQTNVIKKVSTNVNQFKYTAVVDPFDANTDENYSIDESWEMRSDPNDFDKGLTL